MRRSLTGLLLACTLTLAFASACRAPEGAEAIEAAVPPPDQVEQVAIKAGGLSCGTCALVSEMNLRKLEGVGGVTISLSNDAVLVSYEPGAPFRPKEILDVFKPLEVTVRSVQISARGHVEEQGSEFFFVAGKDRFALLHISSGPDLPIDTPIVIQAVLVNHEVAPMQLRVMAAELATP